MSSREKQYRIIIEEVEVETPNRLEFEFQDREDLFKIVDSVKQGSSLEPTDATRLAVALRLLGPIMMKDRKHPLFVDFMPHFKSFMHNLKSTVKQTLKTTTNQ